MNEKSIKSKIFLNLFKKFDMPIRFAYTRIPIARDIAQKLTFKLLYKSSNEKVWGNYTLLSNVYKKHKLTFKNKTIMEVGPGTSLVLALALLHEGAKKIILLDKFPRWDYDTTSDEVNFLTNQCGMNVSKFLDEDLKPKKEFFQYTTNSIESMTDVADSSVDLITSFGVLEHIRNTDSTFKEMHRILKKSGHMYHFISLGDHYNFTDPLVFLKYSDFIWNKITKEGYSYTNRLRVDDYLQLLEKYNFKLKDHEKKFCEIDKIGKINEKFKSKDEETLRTVHSYILAGIR